MSETTCLPWAVRFDVDCRTEASASPVLADLLDDLILDSLLVVEVGLPAIQIDVYLLSSGSQFL